MNEIDKNEVLMDTTPETEETVYMEHELHVTAGTIARTIILILAIVNQVLTMLGKPILPINNEQIAELVASVWTIVMSFITWWKNNSFTQAALAGDVVMRSLKLGAVEIDEDAD